MRMIFCNKYFFLNGGTESYLYNIMNYLSARGHTTIPFSVRYAATWPSAYQDYFLGPPGDPDQAHLSDIRFSPANILRFLDRSTYSFEARIKLGRLLKAVGGADIAYILNIYNYMSPSIIHTFKHHHIPVVARIGDYHLICPNYTLLRNGKPCTCCIRGQYQYGLKYRCVKNNLAASMVRVTSMYLQRWLGLYQLVDAFVVPCLFMKTKLVESGFPEKLIHILQSPVDRTIKMNNALHKKKYIVYFGRISYEKGIDTLIAAFQKLNPPEDLYIIGRSYDGEEERLKSLIEPHAKNRIHFLGFLSGQTLSQRISEALFCVVPSRWYDNAPLSINESFLHGTPVLGSRIGGIPEQILDGTNGLLFEPDSCEDLMQKMDSMLSNKDRLNQMGKAGKAHVKQHLCIDDHVNCLMNLFGTVIADYNRR
jgi:glycosyltransferase involved in cell wall biosynthesis